MTDKEIQEFIQRADEGDVWLKYGMTLFVIKHRHDAIPDDLATIDYNLNFLKSGYWNGYVSCNVPLVPLQLDEIDVHGGVTLTGNGEVFHLYGFDTDHAEDFNLPKSKEYVIAETEKLAAGIARWKKYYS